MDPVFSVIVLPLTLLGIAAVVRAARVPPVRWSDEVRRPDCLREHDYAAEHLVNSLAGAGAR